MSARVHAHIPMHTRPRRCDDDNTHREARAKKKEEGKNPHWGKTALARWAHQVRAPKCVYVCIYSRNFS